MIERFLELADVRDNTLLDMAVMTENGLEEWRRDDANTCNNGHSSIKAFVSVCIGMLRDEGKVDIHRPAAEYFPELCPADMDPRWRRVTVEHLLQHLCGQAEEGAVGFEEDEVAGDGQTDLLTLVMKRPMAFEPGEHYRYSDDNYYFLSRIVEKASGMWFDRFIGLRLGRPMGFRDFAVAIDPFGHNLGGGCMYMRAGDMAKLGYMLACEGVYGGRRLLSAEWVRWMRERSYGLNQFRGSDVFIKTGAFGQGVTFSSRRPIAAAWHRTPYLVRPEPDRNDMMLLAFQNLAREAFGG